MKSIITFFSLLLLTAFVFTSCKKEDAAPTVSQRLVGKWYDEKFVTDLLSGGAHIYDTSFPEPGDYNEFFADNVLYFGDAAGPYQQVEYFVLGNDKLVIDNGTTMDTLVIYSFTSNRLVLRSEYDDAGDHYVEDWYMTK